MRRLREGGCLTALRGGAVFFCLTALRGGAVLFFAPPPSCYRWVLINSSEGPLFKFYVQAARLEAAISLNFPHCPL